MRAVEGYDGYFVDREGRVYSNKSGKIRQLKTSICYNGYEMISLHSKGKKVYHALIHRLVAKAYIPNPDNLPEVNHKDKVRNNNHVDNLEWCTRKANLYDSYETMSPVRNFSTCDLYVGDKHIGEFQSISAAARKGKEMGYRFHSLSKYLVCGDMKIIPQNGDRRPTIERTYVQHRGEAALYKDGELIGIFKSKSEASRYANANYGIDSEKLVSRGKHAKQKIELVWC